MTSKDEMAHWHKVDFAYEVRLVGCALYGPGESEPHTTLEGPEALRESVIRSTTTGYTGTAEYLFGHCTAKAGINSREQLIPLEAVQHALQHGSYEGMVQVPVELTGAFEYLSGKETKPLERAVFSVRVRLSPKAKH